MPDSLGTFAVANNGAKTNRATIHTGGSTPAWSASTIVGTTNIFTILSAQTPKSIYPKFPAVSATEGTASSPISGGTYAKMTKGRYIGFKMSDFIAGLANTTLKFGNAEFVNAANRRSFRNTQSNRRYNITSWNWATGKPTYGANRGVSTDFGADNAVVHSTLANPGDIQFMQGGANPKRTSYGSKNSY